MSSVGLRMVSEGPRRKARREKRRTRRAAWVTLGLVLVLVLGSVFASAKVLDVLRGEPDADYAGPGFGEVVVELTPGATISAIGRVLAGRGVIASPGSFINAAETDARATRVQPGWYRLRQQMRAQDALVALLDPVTRAENKVSLPEGLRLTDMLARISKSTGLPQAALAAAAKGGDLGLPAYAKGQAEGFLFPTTYQVAPDATPEDALRPLVTRFDEVAERLGVNASRKPTPHEVVVVASLVEAEASRSQDYGKVARVVYNRLALGMALQFDSTVNYALNAKKAIVLNRDLKVDSPYNTYLHKGLPPGPINSPGEAALRAALSPTPGEWVFFVTTNLKTGETKFTSSPARFEEFKNELKRNRAG